MDHFDSNDEAVLPAVLVVDDEAIQRDWVSLALRRAGWRVVEADNGPAAVEAASAGGIALVLMDVQLPGLDGFATSRAIRALEPPTCHVPILAFTATPVDDGGRRFCRAGMDGYVVKPSKPRALADAIETWRPSIAPLPARRLETLLGEGELSSLLGRFRASVADALAVLDDPIDRGARAHRLAGLAGTLGFDEIFQTWLALSEGDESALEPARVAARKGLRDLDRDLEMTEQR